MCVASVRPVSAVILDVCLHTSHACFASAGAAACDHSRSVATDI